MTDNLDYAGLAAVARMNFAGGYRDGQQKQNDKQY
jgi:hypothetical protein